MPENDDLLETARKEYARCREWWGDNQDCAKDDLRFARLGEQWPSEIEQQRLKERRPCLTFNKMPAFIRQVVNDARQNKPAVKVHPQDSGADKRTAEIINGLIRNIETTSDADTAYDTAIEHAVGQGFGFWRINTAYTCDDAFDQDIVVERVTNPFTVYGDPRSKAADSSDWNVAFIVTTLSKEEFEREYPDAEKTNWEHDYRDYPDWMDGEDVVVAEYWTREKVKAAIVGLDDGTVVKQAEYDERAEEYTEAGISVVGEPREVESYKVTQRIMSGAEVLKTVEWAGKFIPIVPVYGDEVIDEDGKRHFRSLIRDAKGAQINFNFMRTAGAEGLALQPRVPFIGEKGVFDVDPNWDTANSVTHAYLEYAPGKKPPQRQPLPSIFTAALQEALNASDDMKSIIGIYDASLGARSNETSGRAIMARQREGDVSTFHFIDNLQRAIRHGGRILLDLIPKVYTTERIVRILGEDMKPETVQIAPTGQAVMERPDESGNMSAIYDITAGKYDLTVKTGPSYTTRREEAALEMQEMMRAAPESAALIGDLWAEQQDWPLSDKIAERLKLMLPPQLQEGQPQIPPQVQQQLDQSQQMIAEGTQVLQQQQQALQEAQQQIQALQMANKDKSDANALKAQELEIKRYEAETARMQATQPPMVRPNEARSYRM
jgi:hypothetical protein